jgi:hypothetical protein
VDPPIWADINRRPFTVCHTLGDNRLLEITSLAELAGMPRGENGGAIFCSRKADRDAQSLADSILHLDERDDWIKISYANELDPGYRRIHDDLLDELASLSGIPIRQSMGYEGAWRLPKSRDRRRLSLRLVAAVAATPIVRDISSIKKRCKPKAKLSFRNADRS